jgi:hypothetical protein
MKMRTSQPATPPLTPPLDVHASVHLRVTVVAAASGSEDLSSGIRGYAQQLPALASLPPGAWIAVQLAPERRGLLNRALGRNKHQPLKLAQCCTALLASGYERICVDPNERVFGRVPLR